MPFFSHLDLFIVWIDKINSHNLFCLSRKKRKFKNFIYMNRKIFIKNMLHVIYIYIIMYLLKNNYI